MNTLNVVLLIWFGSSLAGLIVTKINTVRALLDLRKGAKTVAEHLVGWAAVGRHGFKATIFLVFLGAGGSALTHNHRLVTVWLLVAGNILLLALSFFDFLMEQRIQAAIRREMERNP